MTAAEDKVKRLAKLKCNTICPNCGTEKKFGFTTVCIKFFTFVCNECKSSHQAISHRCKSLTMSSWTDEEVSELERKGNDYCRRTWLKNAPPYGTSGRPQSGSDLAVYKRFVVDVYEQKRYYGADGELVAAANSFAALRESDSHQKQINPVTKRIQPSSIKAPNSQVSQPLDLLDFSSAQHSIPVPTASNLFGDFEIKPSVSNSLPLPIKELPSRPAAQVDFFSSSIQDSNISNSKIMPSDDLFGDFVSAPQSSVMPSGYGIQSHASSQQLPTPSTNGFQMNTNFPAMPSSSLCDFQGLVMNSPNIAGLSNSESSTENLISKKPIMGSNCQGNAITMMTTMPTSESKTNHFNSMAMNQHNGVSGMYSHGVLTNQGNQPFTMQQQLPNTNMVGLTNHMNGNSFGMNQSYPARATAFGSGIAAMHEMGPGHISFMTSVNHNSNANSKTDSMPGGNIMDLWSNSQKKS
jgi:Putative GTPase activating protein for Arf